MCGIAAIFSINGSEKVNLDQLVRVCDAMKSRGPDGSGKWISTDKRVGLAHRRLAIIDLSAGGAQPMSSEDGNLVITFNGEIYNYLSLRESLESKGYQFRSTSDTEVLLYLYAEKGEDMLRDLRGMFAFVIWDANKKRIFIARDPFGIKPLYYVDDGKNLRVASQVKALLAGGGIETSPQPAGHVGFFIWGHVPEPYTLYKEIKALPAGSFLWVDTRGKRKSSIYCQISDELAIAARKPEAMVGSDGCRRLRDALLNSVRHHLISDVPVGVFLSSGIDSTTLVALASEVSSKPLNSITLGFREFQGTRNDEVPLAEMVAQKFGVKHRTIWVNKDDFRSHHVSLLKAMDQPTIDGVNSFFVSYAAKEAGIKVVLSGLGGDELFGSYPSFNQIPRMVSILTPMRAAPRIGRAFRIMSGILLEKFTSPKYAGLLEYGNNYGGAYILRRGLYMPWELPKLLDPEMVREGWETLQTLVRLEETVKNINNNYLKVAALEICWYMRNQLLRDTDWASMAHSIEIRVPFVDIEFLRAIAPMLGAHIKPRKRDLGITPLNPIPSEVLSRKKSGFSVPLKEWLLAEADSPRERGLRGWAKRVYQEHVA